MVFSECLTREAGGRSALASCFEEKLLPVGGHDDEPAQFCPASVRQVDSSVFGDCRVASALLGGHLRDDGQVTLLVCAGDGEFSHISSAHIQHVSGWLIVNVIDAIAGINLRDNGAVMPDVEYLRKCTAGDKQVAGLRVQPQSVRTFFPARWIPG